MGALGARRVPRERVRGLSALRLVERSGTEITVVKRRPRQRALRKFGTSHAATPAGAVPVRCPHLGGFRLRGSCAYSRTHFLSLRRQTTVFFQTSQRGGEYREAPAQDQSSSSPTETALLRPSSLINSDSCLVIIHIYKYKEDHIKGKNPY